MPTRAVAAIAKVKEVIEAVAAIPAESRTVYERYSINAGAAGIFLQPSAALSFSGHGMRGQGPATGTLTFSFVVVIRPDQISEEAPATDLIAIAEAIRLAFETSITTDAAWKGIGAIFIENMDVAAVDDVEPVIQVDFAVHGFF
jgi:hypothetical protein